MNLNKKEDIKKTVEIKPLKKKFPWKLSVILAIILVIIGGIVFLVVKGFEFSKSIGFKFDANSIFTNIEKPELKKDSTGKYTNFLAIGIDTREKSDLLNTDTIIVASYNYDTRKVTMYSIPRDFHVEIGENTDWYARINAVYANAEAKESGSGIVALEKTVEEITGKEIQYHAMVDFKAFTEIIDTIGGIDINVENSFTDYSYPLGTGYQTVKFVAGPQTMDGETALEYARSRHSQQNNEGTDYARARRQQKVIIAVKDKLLSTETLTNPQKIMSILSSVANNIKISEFTIQDIEAAINLAKDFQANNGNTYSFVLEPSCGNYSLIEVKPMASGAYAIGPKLGFGKYTDIQKYINTVEANPQIYSENPKIAVYNTGLGSKDASAAVVALKEAFPYLNITYYGNLYSDKEGTVVYATKENTKTESVTKIAEYFKTTLTTQPEYIKTTAHTADINILLGKAIVAETTDSTNQE